MCVCLRVCMFVSVCIFVSVGEYRKRSKEMVNKGYGGLRRYQVMSQGRNKYGGEREKAEKEVWESRRNEVETIA